MCMLLQEKVSPICRTHTIFIYIQLHLAVSRSQQGRQREPSVKTVPHFLKVHVRIEYMCNSRGYSHALCRCATMVLILSLRFSFRRPYRKNFEFLKIMKTNMALVLKSKKLNLTHL